MRRLVSLVLLLTLPFAGIPPVAAASLGGTSPPADTRFTVVEYYHATLDHYFVTANDAEKALLDSGATRGWTRTGQEFEAYPPSAASAVASPVCRFYGRPEAGLDSHFYSASSDECGIVARKFASSWQFESGNVFRIQLPDTTTGICPAGTLPVYRLFNNRRDANHRYTTEKTIRDQMVSAGHIPEGYGSESVAFCATAKAMAPTPVAPTPPVAPVASIAVAQGSSDTFTFTGTATPAEAATIVSRTWDHGDGTFATGATSTHTYTASGTYTVRFTVTDNAGLSTTATTSVTATVAPSASAAPTVAITANQMSSDTFSFSSTVAVAASLAVAAYAWDFGDGASASGPTATHTYAAAGTYSVKLTATDTKGRSGTASRNVTATKTPAPPVATGPSPQALPGKWMKYNTSYAAGNEAEYQSWYNLAWDTKRNVAYGLSWQAVLSAFDPVSGVWKKLTPNIGGGVHNRTTAYDPINDRVWVGSGTGSQLIGVHYYDPNTGQWVSHPMSGRTPGSEAAMIYDDAGKRFVVFGGWGRLGVHTFALAPVAYSMTSVPITGGPEWDSGSQAVRDAAKMTAWRSALDKKRGRIVYVDPDGSLWVLPLTLTGWQKVATTGGPPPVYTQYVYDESADALIGWSASPRISVGDPVAGVTQETWLLPMTTLAWTRGANVVAGDVVPKDTSYVQYSMVHDPVRQQTILHTLDNSSNYEPSTWAYKYPTGTVIPTPSPTPGPTPSPTPSPAPAPVPAPSPTPPTLPPAPVTTTYGTITSFPLPSIREAPYSTVITSKHTNMSFSPLTGRLYVQGGDWLHSATDGTWSMNLSDGSWRRDVGEPVYPTLPAPHALQDGAGFEWVPSRNKFLLWPGSYYPYGCSFTFTDPRCLTEVPTYNYSRGMWWFDPITNAYTQELGVFGTMGESSGSLHGGVYDEVNDQILVIADSARGKAVRRWDVGRLTRLADLPINISVPAANPAAKGSYFTRGKHAKIGRHVYVVGYATDGTPSVQIPRLWRWHLDNHTFEELATPPVDGTLMRDLEIRLGVSHGKVVWPFHSGPEGELHGIYVYDPATNTWAVDKQVPPYGNFIGNSVSSLPDGRVVFSGGQFGRQQTHIWFYEAR